MRVFLTGATGFIGSHLLKLFLQRSHSVVALRRNANSKPKIKMKHSPQWITKDLQNVCVEDFCDSQIVVHLAAHTANVPYDKLLTCLDQNLIAPLKLFENARSAGINKFLVAGTCFEYGLAANQYEKIPPTSSLVPTNTYSASKAAASIAFTQWALENKLSMSIVRLFQIYGEGESETRLWPSLLRAAEQGLDFPMTRGEQLRDFMNVHDAAFLLEQECESLLNSQYPHVKHSNIGSGEPQTIAEFSTNVWQSLDPKGSLKQGAIPYRAGEVMRYLPLIESVIYRGDS